MNRVTTQASPAIINARSIWVVLLFFSGLCLRLYFAGHLFLNPDESLHYLLSQQPSLGDAYRASLSTAHPPLLILFLYFWRYVGDSEILLRGPNVIAGLIFCWLIYKWVARVAGRRAADLILPLLIFAPTLVDLSAEIRQYMFMLMFMSAALYTFEVALERRSPWQLAAFTCCLALALLSHYSAFFFILAVGVYAMVRLAASPYSRSIWAVWASGQILIALLCWFLLKSHIEPYRRSGIPQIMADNWLRTSIYHRANDHVFMFVGRNTARVFAYTFSNGLIGALALALFLVTIVLLVKRSPRLDLPIEPRSFAVLLIAPVVIALAASIAGAYPYGGTRHDAFLIPFLLTGAVMPLTLWSPRQTWLPIMLVLLAVLVSGVFQNPRPSMNPATQKISHMQSAISILRSNPPDSVIFTDYQSGLVLGYYLCNRAVVQLIPPDQEFLRTQCGGYDVIAESPWVWNFTAGNFSMRLKEMRRNFALAPQPITVFQTGWGIEKDIPLQRAFVDSGCGTQKRPGPAILICEVEPTH
jgi:uncharacterized membrane protein